MKFNIFDLLLPRETKFYTMLTDQAECLLDISKQFRVLVSDLQSGNNDETLKSLVMIKELEKRGDKYEKSIVEELDKTFITPLDREDINRIAMQMGIVIDDVNSISRMMEIYGIRQCPSAVMSFCDILVGICAENVCLIKAVQGRKGLQQSIKLMHEFEKRGDDTFHQGMASLFETAQPLEIIKFKSVYESLEETIDGVDAIGKLIRSIMIKLG
jgi:uncharacterized protein